MKQPRTAAATARHRVFAYGTLLEPARQRRLFGREVPVAPAVLSGWRRSRCVGRYFGIQPSAGALTRGGLLQLSTVELKAADGWEKVPELYRRCRARVRVEVAPVRAAVGAKSRAATVTCWTYVPADVVDPVKHAPLPRR